MDSSSINEQISTNEDVVQREVIDVQALKDEVKKLPYGDIHGFDTRLRLLKYDVENTDTPKEKAIDHIFVTILNGVKSCREAYDVLQSEKASNFSQSMQDRMKLNSLSSEKGQVVIKRLIAWMEINYGKDVRNRLKALWFTSGEMKDVDTAESGATVWQGGNKVLRRMLSLDNLDSEWDPFKDESISEETSD
jgi:hypothetical protein